MSAAVHALPGLAAPGAASASVSIAGIPGRIRFFFAVRRACAALQRLDDRTLKDVGIARERIPEIVRASLRRH